MAQEKAFSADVLKLDAVKETDRIVAALCEQVHGVLRRKGLVVGLSGGIDSSVCCALAARAFGGKNVFGVRMPESDSSGDTMDLSELIASHFGVTTALEVITPTLEAVGCYRRRDDFIRSVVPEFGPGYKSKIVFPSVLEGQGYRVFRLVVEAPDGTRTTTRLPLEAYLGIVAATNFKQRVRKMIEYYHADRLNFAVVGTPNRLEFDQGFFVKNGDGSADVKPIAHLYKSQVYQLAEYLGVPEKIRSRPPTTDTYSLSQSQEEFYFSLPYRGMDICLYAKDHGISAAEAAVAAGITPAQAEHVYADIDAKRNATAYHHRKPLLVEEIPHIQR